MIQQQFKTVVWLMLVVFILNAKLSFAQSVPFKKGRIVISSDGNEHDKDDWAATPFSLALLASQGLQDRLTVYTFSDHIWGSNIDHSDAEEQMRESAIEGGKQFNFDKTNFIEAVKNPNGAYNAIRDEINKSSEADPLTIVAAGPMQVVGEGISRANSDKLKYVRIISHSSWNNKHSDKPLDNEPSHTGWTWNEIEDEFSGDGLIIDLILDQNGGTDYDGMRADIAKFSWLQTSDKKDKAPYKIGSWDWLYERQEAAQKKQEFDPSDAGMIIYLLTGIEQTDPADAKQLMENPVLNDDDNDGGFIELPAKIEAEGFVDMQGVDTEATSDIGGGLSIAYIQNNDYVDYDVEVPLSGSYLVTFRVASKRNGGAITLLDGEAVLGTSEVGNTGGWQSWEEVDMNVNLQAGQYRLRLMFTGGNGYLFNVNWLQFDIVNETAKTSNNSLQQHVEREVMYYPNPFTAKLNVNTVGLYDVHQIQVFDVLGVVVFSKDYAQPAQQMTLDFDQMLPKGVYIIQLKTDQGTKVLRAIKE